jgi:hypothetical protein
MFHRVRNISMICRLKRRYTAHLSICFATISVATIAMTARAEETKVPVAFTGGHELAKNDFGRPINLMAAGLGVKPDEFRKAFSGVTPARGRGPTGEEQRRNKEALMKVLGPLKVTNERMDEVANYYRFRPQKGELWPTKPAEAYAIIAGGKIKEIVVTEPGSGFNTPPKATIDGFKNTRLESKIKYDKDLKKNGGIESVEIVTDDPKAKQK